MDIFAEFNKNDKNYLKNDKTKNNNDKTILCKNARCNYYQIVNLTSVQSVKVVQKYFG